MNTTPAPAITVTIDWSQFQGASRCWLEEAGENGQALRPVSSTRSRSGRTGTRTYLVQEGGLYVGSERGEQVFVVVEDNKPRRITVAEYLARVESYQGV